MWDFLLFQVDENMKVAQKRDAALKEKFYFRKDLTTRKILLLGYIVWTAGKLSK